MQFAIACLIYEDNPLLGILCPAFEPGGPTRPHNATPRNNQHRNHIEETAETKRNETRRRADQHNYIEEPHERRHWHATRQRPSHAFSNQPTTALGHEDDPDQLQRHILPTHALITTQRSNSKTTGRLHLHRRPYTGSPLGESVNLIMEFYLIFKPTFGRYAGVTI